MGTEPERPSLAAWAPSLAAHGLSIIDDMASWPPAAACRRPGSPEAFGAAPAWPQPCRCSAVK